MKNLKKLWSLSLLLAATMFMVSCDDDPVIDVDEDGLAVANGYYFTLEGEDPVAEKALLPEVIEGDDFAPTEREGFFGNYVYLPAGNYMLQEVVDREVASTIGGELGPPEGEDEGYLIAEVSEGGSEIEVAENGYYKVSYDEELSELIMMKVTSVSLIGDATPNGWGSDTPLEVEVEASDEGFVFSGSDIVMRGGQYKIRINNRWTIDRRIDRTAETFDPNNGYVAFTNYGGTADNLVAGGANIEFPTEDEGVYTVTVELTNEGGAALETEFTGEVEPIVFEPTENNWAVVGAATDLGWPANNDCGVADQDVDMTYDGEANGVYTWSVELDLAADEFKFRKNDCWDGDLGYADLEITGPAAASFTESSGNVINDNNGRYRVELSTENDGESYIASFELLEDYADEEPSTFDPTQYNWGLIGDAAGGWNDGDDVALEYIGEAEGVHTWALDAVDFTADQFKLRANGSWDVSLGFSALTIEGAAAGNFVDAGADDNIEVTTAGTYAVSLSTADEGGTYVLTVE